MKTETLKENLNKLKELGGHPRFYELLLQIAELHARKNHDYAKDNDPLSNLRQSEEFGVPGSLGIRIRMGDKWSRIRELSKKSAMVKSEPLEDALMDNAVYSLLTIILLEEEQKKK